MSDVEEALKRISGKCPHCQCKVFGPPERNYPECNYIGGWNNQQWNEWVPVYSQYETIVYVGRRRELHYKSCKIVIPRLLTSP